MTTYLKRDDILAVQDLQRAEVDVSQWWGGIVLVRELTAAEVQELGFGMTNPEGGVDPTRDKRLMSRMAAWGIIDEEGNTQFTEQDLDELGQKSFAPIQLISRKIMEMSGLRRDKGDSEGNG
jgi:hypothetical protein